VTDCMQASLLKLPTDTTHCSIDALGLTQDESKVSMAALESSTQQTVARDQEEEIAFLSTPEHMSD